MTKTRILLTNDDGIDGKGLLALADALKDDYEIYICAPDRQRSSSSHSILYVHEEIVLEEVEIPGVKKAWKCSGTPADCTYLGIYALNKEVDLVISGINQGQNISSDCHYSGTVGAAYEGLLYGFPSIAVSLASNHYPDFSPSVEITRQMIPEYLKDPDCGKYVMNINVPPLPSGEIKGIRKARFEPKFRYLLDFARREEGKKMMFRINGGRLDYHEADSDITLLRNGYAVVTPLSDNLVDETVYRRMKEAF